MFFHWFLKYLLNMIRNHYVPRLNIAIPRPASDRIDMDPLRMVGILISHLSINKYLLKYYY